MPGKERETPADSAVASDVAAMVAQAFAGLSAGAGSAVSDEPQVFFGSVPGGRTRSKGGLLDDMGGGTRQGSSRDDLRSLDAANVAFYGLTLQQLAEFQQRIVSSGIARADQVMFGDYDDNTYRVWQAINERSARFLAAGQKVTPAEALDMMARAAQSMGGVSGDTGDVNVRTDPLTLEQQVQAAARQHIGRKLTKKEADKFAAIYQGMQASGQDAYNAAKTAAEDGVTSTVTDVPDASTAADQYLDASFAQEQAGVDSLGYLGALEQMLGGS